MSVGISCAGTSFAGISTSTAVSDEEEPGAIGADPSSSYVGRGTQSEGSCALHSTSGFSELPPSTWASFGSLGCFCRRFHHQTPKKAAQARKTKDGITDPTMMGMLAFEESSGCRSVRYLLLEDVCDIPFESEPGSAV